MVRGEQVQPIQELVTLHDIDVSLATDRKAKAVRLVPDGPDLAFTTRAGRTRFTVPKLTGHAVVEVAY